MKNSNQFRPIQRIEWSVGGVRQPLSLPKDLDAPYAHETRHLAFDDLRKALTGLTKLIEEFKQLTGPVANEPNRLQTNLP